MVVIVIVNMMEYVMSNLKHRIKEILDSYKTANLYSETVRDRIASELYEKLGDDGTPQRHGWDEDYE